MTLHDTMSTALRQVAEQVAKEQDPEKLRQFILGINVLLDAVEKRVAELEGKGNTSTN
jgi:hypothetical protein